MQPRLVAISYPSSVGDDGCDETSRWSRTRDSYLGFHTKLSGRLHCFSDSWSDLRSHVRILRRRDGDRPGQAAYDRFDPCDAPNSSARYLNYSPADHMAGSKWQLLPQPIQVKVLKCLKQTYDQTSHVKNHQLWRSDLLAMQSSCRAWASVAQKELYCEIEIKPSYIRERFSRPVAATLPTRILQLRHTLRSNTRISNLVKHLTLLPENQQHDAQKESYSDSVASVVMTCPKLESLTTFHIPYNHNFNRFFHAISTRTKLTRHTWVIGEDPLVQTRAGRRYRSGILSTQQNRLFLQHHAYWRDLETLNMISHNGRGVLEHDLFVKALNMLPSLKNLNVSSFDANDFSDETLRCLPPLSSLTLSNCAGINEAGLRVWAESDNAANIHNLVLENQNVTSLLTIVGLLEALTLLESFRLLQLSFEPGLPLELEVEEPLFKSESLKKLEWYTAACQNSAYLSDPNNDLQHNLHENIQSWPRSKSSQLLLSSILDFGLPNLQKVILPGYDNLNGLLRWLRHSSWVTRPQSKPTTVSTYHTSTSNEPCRASIFSNHRNTVRLSLRPTSPNFDQYDHWRKPPSDHPPVIALAELLNRHSTITQRLAAGSVPASPTALPTPPSPALSSHSTASSAEYSPTNSHYHSNSSAASTQTAPSTSSLLHNNFEVASNSIVLVKDEIITPRLLDDGLDGDGNDPAIQYRDQVDTHSRQSSISDLLDQYAETGSVMMSGALIED